MKPYYEHAGITIYHGDCLSIVGGVEADALITDPPYGVNLGHHAAAKETRGWLAKSAYASYDDSPENFESVVVVAITSALMRVRRGLVFTSGTGLRQRTTPLAAYSSRLGVGERAGDSRTSRSVLCTVLRQT